MLHISFSGSPSPGCSRYNSFSGSGQTFSRHSIQTRSQEIPGYQGRAGQVTHPAHHIATNSCVGARVGRGSKKVTWGRKNCSAENCLNLMVPCTHLGAKSVKFSFVSDLPHKVLRLQQPTLLHFCHLKS